MEGPPVVSDALIADLAADLFADEGMYVGDMRDEWVIVDGPIRSDVLRSLAIAAGYDPNTIGHH
jgi:hypothetical protein